MKNKARNAALITGAAKKIGREMALSLASQGFDIAITYNTSKQDAQKLAEEIVKKNSKQKKLNKLLKEIKNKREALNNINQNLYNPNNDEYLHTAEYFYSTDIYMYINSYICL
mgnify:CR=1 FL=1